MRMRCKKNAPQRMEQAGELLVSDPASLRGEWKSRAFDRPYERLELEIGCGKGKFVLAKAEMNPAVGYIAIERNRDVLICALEAAMTAKVGNVRFLYFDARLLADIFSPGEINGVYLNFSDPWPKSGYRKRRLTSPEFLARYAEILPPDGTVAFKTDNSPFFEDSVCYFQEAGYEILTLTRDLHRSEFAGGNVTTEYEELFATQGKTINQLTAGVPKNKEWKTNDK